MDVHTEGTAVPVGRRRPRPPPQTPRQRVRFPAYGVGSVGRPRLCAHGCVWSPCGAPLAGCVGRPCVGPPDAAVSQPPRHRSPLSPRSRLSRPHLSRRPTTRRRGSSHPPAAPPRRRRWTLRRGHPQPPRGASSKAHGRAPPPVPAAPSCSAASRPTGGSWRQALQTHPTPVRTLRASPRALATERSSTQRRRRSLAGRTTRKRPRRRRGRRAPPDGC